jgi:hypothetical protein
LLQERTFEEQTNEVIACTLEIIWCDIQKVSQTGPLKDEEEEEDDDDDARRKRKASRGKGVKGGRGGKKTSNRGRPKKGGIISAVFGDEPAEEKVIMERPNEKFPTWVHITPISAQTSAQFYFIARQLGIDSEHDNMNDGLSVLCLLARYGSAEAFSDCYSRVCFQTYNGQMVMIPPHPNLYFQGIVFNAQYGYDIIHAVATKYLGPIIEKFVSLAQIDDQIANNIRGRGKRIKDDNYGKDDKDMFLRKLRLLRIDDLPPLPEIVTKCLAPNKQVCFI